MPVGHRIDQLFIGALPPLAGPAHRRLSRRVRTELSHILSHLIASLAKRATGLPSRVTLSPLCCQCLCAREARVASIVDVSKRTAFSSAHLRLATARCSSLCTT